MQKFDWFETISSDLFLIRLVGLWPEKNKLYERNWYTYYAGINAILIIAFHNFSQFINIFFVYKNLEILTATIFILITNLLATAKMYVFARNLKRIKHLFVILESKHFQPKPHQIEAIQPTLKRYKILFHLFVGIVLCNITSWSLAPFVDPDLELPFVAWYPFDIAITRNYILVYLYQVICIWYITIANLSLDGFIYAILMYIGVQVDLLCDNLRKLNENYHAELIGAIKHHKELVQFAKRSNNLFNFLILGQFATTTMVLALTMFQLTLVDPTSQAAVSNINYLIGITTQLFLYCYYGNEVEIKVLDSSRLAFSLYESNWFEQSMQVRKSMLIFSERCKNPIKITAIDLFGLTLQTFVTILRSAWSYFAVLYSVNSE